MRLPGDERLSLPEHPHEKKPQHLRFCDIFRLKLFLLTKSKAFEPFNRTCIYRAASQKT
jgi:hypothetical protein